MLLHKLPGGCFRRGIGAVQHQDVGLGIGLRKPENPASTAPMNRLPCHRQRDESCASTMPPQWPRTGMQCRGVIDGRLRNRTMDSAPTMPRLSTTLLVTARISRLVIMVRAIRVTPKLAEYSTPA